MESLLVNLLNHISSSIPRLRTVDEDYGQLEAIDDDSKDMYPLTFPAVLIDTPTTSWSNTGNDGQIGECSLRVRLVIDCYDDTHTGSHTTDRILQREELRKELHRALQGFRPDGMGALVRTESKFFTWNHGIKVYEASYTCRVEENVRETRKVGKSAVSLSVRV